MKLTAIGRRRRYALTLFLQAALLISAVGCSDDCHRSVGSEFHSPNGQWTARAERSICGGKILAFGSDSTVVELRRHKPNYKDLSEVVLSAEGLGAEDLKIRWLSNYQLELTVPARSNISLLIAIYQDVDVAMRFTPSDPGERARWVEYRRALAEWADQMTLWDRKRIADPSSVGPPPVQPQWQPSAGSKGE